MQYRTRNTLLLQTAAILLAAVLFPMSAFAEGLFVPVSTGLDDKIDALNSSVVDLNNKASDLINVFRDVSIGNDSNSLRTYLSMNPGPGTVAKLYNPGQHAYPGGGKSVAPMTACSLRPITNPGKATAIPGGAWQQLLNDGVIDDSGNYEGVKVNDSASISCLLQEIVEQNKLSTNIQIHQLLNEYIQAAQAKALAERMKSKEVQASINYINNGNVIVTKDDSGNIVSETSYSLINGADDRNKALLDNNTRQLTDAALGVGPTPSINTPFGPEIARAAKVASRDIGGGGFADMTKRLSTTAGTDGSHFASADDLKKFLAGDADAVYSGSYFDALQEASLPQNNPLGATQLASDLIAQKYQDIQQTSADDLQNNNGISSSYKCAPDDFYCANPIKVSPGSLAGGYVQENLNAKTRDLSNVKDATDLEKLDQSSPSGTQLLQDGIANAPDTAPTANQNTDNYVSNFYNAIESGYFDLQGGTVDWALGAMLQIYDHVVTDPKAISPNGKPTTTD